MHWLILLASGALEAVWAIALDRSAGLTQPLPAIVFLVALALSMLGLGIAVKRIPIGTAYAVWTGIGASLTVLAAAALGEETLTLPKALCLAGVIGAVIGLRLLGEGADPDATTRRPRRSAPKSPSGADKRSSP